MGRKLMKGHWRDDGVAFDWVLSRNNTGASGTVKDNEVREIADVVDAPSPRTGEQQDQLEEEEFIPVETQTPPLNFLGPNGILGPAQNTATGPVASGVLSPQPSFVPQMQQPSQESQSGEKVASLSAIAPLPAPAKYFKAETKWGPPIIGKPPARGRINRIYKYDIPVPKSMRVGGCFAPEFQAWKLRHRDEACCFDARGCPTREVFLNHNSVAACDHLSMKIVPIDMSNPDSWPMSMFPDQVSVPIPASITPGEEFDAWSTMICDRISEPDWRGRPTRWVRPLHIPSSTGQFKIKLRAKTREEIESYNGPAIFPSQASPLELGPKAADKVDNSPSSSSAIPKAGASAKLNQSLSEHQKKRISNMLEEEAAEVAKKKRRTSESYFEREWNREKRPGSPAFKEERSSKMQKKDTGLDKSRQREKEKEQEREREKERAIEAEREKQRGRALESNGERGQSSPHYSSRSVYICIKNRLIIFFRFQDCCIKQNPRRGWRPI